MATVYDVLVYLDRHGWRLAFQVGILRRFIHHAHPGLQITVKGEPSASFLDEAFQELRKLHGEE